MKKIRNIRNHSPWMGALMMLGTSCWNAAIAQTDSEEARPSERVLETIVITAERRDRDLQTTSISASVLTGDELMNSGINNIDQLQFATPAAVVNNFGQGIDFNIRGIGKAEHNTQTATGVITYRDGVATFPGYFTGEPYYDIASVEVLRGPQGTFVGQNATGGAVFVRSKDPVIGGDVEGYVQTVFGSHNHFGLQGAVSLPISDTLAARIAFNTDERDSFWDISGPYPGSHPDFETRSARVTLLWEPVEALSVSFKTDYNHLDFGAYPSDPVNSTNDIFKITANAEMLARDRFVRSVLQADYEFSNGIVLRSISGYQDGNTAYKADLDGTATGNMTFRDSVDETIYSQEFNIISPGADRFSWIAGAYYQSDEHHFLPGEFVIGNPPGDPTTEYILDGKNPKTTKAVFGQVAIELSDSVELELGARYSRNRTTNRIFVQQYGLPIEANQSADYSNLSGKVALNWHVNNDHFVYGFFASGYKAGGLNVPVGPDLLDPFEEETVDSYELGWKAMWLDGRIRTQVNAFYNSYDGFQVSIGYPDFPVFSLQLNTPETTKIYGAEAQVQAVLGGFSFNMGLGWVESELGRFYATDPRVADLGSCNPLNGPETAACVNLDGREQSYAPKLTYNFGVEYDFLFGDATITPRLSYSHISSQWATLFQNRALGDRIEERNIVNGQIAWNYRDYSLTLYGTNLTDERYVAAINSGLRFAGAPRQYGLRGAMRF